MSNSSAVSPLNQARFKGLVMVQEEPPHGMITLRGDLSALAPAVKAAVGAVVPEPRQMVVGDQGHAGWMSPDELLLVCPYADVGDRVAAATQAMEDAHHLAVDVSDARAVFTLTGDGGDIRTVLAKLTPADTRAASLQVGELRRTRLSQVPGAFWFSDETTLTVVCFRSVAQYVFDILKAAADPLASVNPS